VFKLHQSSSYIKTHLNLWLFHDVSPLRPVVQDLDLRLESTKALEVKTVDGYQGREKEVGLDHRDSPIRFFIEADAIPKI